MNLYTLPILVCIAKDSIGGRWWKRDAYWNRIVLCDRRKEGETSEFSHNGVRGEIVGIILLPVLMVQIGTKHFRFAFLWGCQTARPRLHNSYWTNGVLLVDIASHCPCLTYMREVPEGNRLQRDFEEGWTESCFRCNANFIFLWFRSATLSDP